MNCVAMCHELNGHVQRAITNSHVPHLRLPSSRFLIQSPFDYSYQQQLMVLNACYNGIGRSSGAVVNGFMKDMFGTQGVFQFAAFSNTMFAILLYSYLRLTSPTSSLRMGSSHVSKKAS
mmetsp:Transcript_15000/g.41544  ORF Transcript_15000/g.41544 Transcript_15000/m.41544 type:complete len:119 (+) Transcript_15000:539-895(+)